MKRLSILLAALSLGMAATAQTLNLHQGAVTTAFAADGLGDMNYTSGTTLTIGGVDYATTGIDSITFDQSEVTAAQVGITYTAAGATVRIPGDMAPYITATVSGGHVVVTATSSLAKEVNYVLAGTSADGSFTLNSSYKCTVTLNGLDLTSTTGGAIDIEDGKRIAIVVADGTTNTLADAAAGTQDACFYVKGHAEFNGAGTLNITGNATHAYKSKEYTELKKKFGTLNVLAAAGDALHVGQYYEQKGGTVVISGAKGDGVDTGATSDTTDENNGQVIISGGSLSIDLGATEDVKGLKADSAITISGGSVTITGSGNGVKGIKTGANFYVNNTSGADPTLSITVTGTTYAKDTENESKTRGVKVDGDFTFDGGTISVSATGKKAKAIAVDGTYTYVSGSINCTVDATTTN